MWDTVLNFNTITALMLLLLYFTSLPFFLLVSGGWSYWADSSHWVEFLGDTVLPTPVPHLVIKCWAAAVSCQAVAIITVNIRPPLLQLPVWSNPASFRLTLLPASLETLLPLKHAHLLPVETLQPGLPPSSLVLCNLSNEGLTCSLVCPLAACCPHQLLDCCQPPTHTSESPSK